MLDVVVNIDQGCSKCLVYKTHESTLSGQLKIKTSDRLKLRQLAIRLVSTELVDINDDVNKSSSSSSAASTTGGGGLHSYLQKTSIAICTWAVLPKNGTAHVLEPGNHQYAIDMPLPKGLNGSIETKAYALRYELETRLEYSFILKPDTVVSTPLELDQVPMARDLYSDDRISLKMPVRLYIPSSDGETFRPEDVPLGQALCIKKDTISQRSPFVFAHLWDNCLSLRLRFPRGRAFSVASQPLISFEALPISKEYKVTKVVAHIEEITIIARPQKAESSSGRQKSHSISFSPGSSATNPYGGTESHNLSETATAGVSSLTHSAIAHTATSSQDSLEPNSLHNALAYAREWSSEYANAITKVRDLGQDTQNSRFGPIELPKSHGMLSGKLHLSMPDSASSKAAHPDMRNSHVQVHHQLVYVVQYHRVKSPAGDNDIVEGSSTVASMNMQRINAAARLYGKLGQSNIVRREELTPNDPPLTAPLTHEYWSKPRTVRGTLPISVVSGKIGELWGIRDITEDYDASDFGQEPDASVDMPLPGSHRIIDGPTIYSAGASPLTMPMPLLPQSRKGQQSMNSSSGGTQFNGTHSPFLNSIQAPMPGSGFAPNVGGMYPPPPPPPPPQFSAAPMGFNPMLLSPQPPYPPFSAYPPSTMDFGSMDPSMRTSFVPPFIPGSPSHPLQQHQQHPYGGVSEAAPYNNPTFQQQIIQFQEQQRQQQQQFFEQLSRQYSQMAVPQQQTPYSATMSNVPEWGSVYPPPNVSPIVTATASISQQSSAEMEQPTTELAATPTLPVSAEQVELPTSLALNRQNTVASEDIMLATVERLEQMSMSQQTSTLTEVSVAETQTDEQQQQQQQQDEAEHDPPIVPPRTASAQSDTSTQEEQPSESAHVAVQSTDDANTRQPAATGQSSPPPNYEDLLPPDYEVPTTQPPPYNAAEGNRSRRLR